MLKVVSTHLKFSQPARIHFFGCTYACLAPEHELVSKITTAAQMAEG